MPVVVEGAIGLKKALAKYAPELKKQYDNEIKAAVKPIITAAKSKVAPAIFGGDNNWGKPSAGFPHYDPNAIRRGLTYSLAGKRSKSGFVSLVTLLNKNAAGAIAETAGRVHPNGRPTSHTVTINKRFRPTEVRVRTTKDSMSNNPFAGAMMIERLNEHIGHLKKYDSDPKSNGRLLYAAYAENQGKALDAIMRAIENANNELDKIMKQDRWTIAA